MNIKFTDCQVQGQYNKSTVHEPPFSNFCWFGSDLDLSVPGASSLWKGCCWICMQTWQTTGTAIPNHLWSWLQKTWRQTSQENQSTLLIHHPESLTVRLPENWQIPIIQVWTHWLEKGNNIFISGKKMDQGRKAGYVQNNMTTFEVRIK